MGQAVERAVHLSLIIPVYNEEGRLSQSLKRIFRFLDSQPFTSEIVVVDDGSRDGTVELASRLGGGRERFLICQNGKNAGKGAAVRNGMLRASGDYLFFTDADLSVPVEAIGLFLPKLRDGFDLAVGSRAKPGAVIEIHQPRYRELMGKVYTFLASWILGVDISDFTCGFKGFRRTAALDLFSEQRVSGWSFDAEILYLAKLKNYSVVEIPVRWRNDNATKVRLWKDVFLSFLELVRIRLHHGRGSCGR